MSYSQYVHVILMLCSCESYTALKKPPCALLDVVRRVDTPSMFAVLFAEQQLVREPLPRPGRRHSPGCSTTAGV